MILQLTKKKIIFILLIALLLVGLFYFYNTRLNLKPKLETAQLKPSQLDFTESNQIKNLSTQSPKESANLTTTVSELVALKTEAPINDLNLPESDLKKWTVLKEIIRTQNDNDPRLNSELKTLSSELHQALYKEYDKVPEEQRNTRGLLVFLISRDLSSPTDIQFLQKVYQEDPCLNLENCKKNSTEDNPHHSSVDQTTLHYPQLVGLYQIDKKLTENPALLKDPHLRDSLFNLLKHAENFAAAPIREKAESIRKKFGL